LKLPRDDDRSHSGPAAPQHGEVGDSLPHDQRSVGRSRRAAACAALLGNQIPADPPAEARRRPALLPSRDVELLRRIQSLLYKEGYTIKGVQRLLREARGGAVGVVEEDLHPTDESALPGHGEAEGDEAHELEHDDDHGDHDEHHYGMTTSQRGDIEAVLMELIALRDMLRSGRP
jgi:DNA-binding transcriptional MerR regulator